MPGSACNITSDESPFRLLFWDSMSAEWARCLARGVPTAVCLTPERIIRGRKLIHIIEGPSTVLPEPTSASESLKKETPPVKS